MNTILLHKDIQDFINKNLQTDTTKLLLKGFDFEGATSKEIIDQIEAKKRCKTKLPQWYTTKNIYYPNKLNIEQTSSETTAQYKANLISGENLIDITGGLGVDTYYFSKHFSYVIHCEINSEVSRIAEHNFKTLKASNIICLNENGIEALKRIDKPFDLVYVDPSRRDDTKSKVFLLSNCTPNVKTFQGLFLKYAKNVMIKTSPLLDITATKNELKHVKELHVVAVNNEVKELLWILEPNFEADFRIKTINITKNENEIFEFSHNDESNIIAEYYEPLTYLYEPNAAILKAGAFNTISSKLDIAKLHKHSHLYTSSELVDFPGRRFKIEKAISYNKKRFAKENIAKANVSTRNFPLKVADIRKKLKLKDGGDTYLFFTTDASDKKIILICKKI
ncbi:class I SAM-dependent methyltransferase [uncultured Winogradskyella sp.]|uniref:class I SAM-dependent methyltransferase n=1 Tax=uncultured Winogradskyella sp. TaxID=395353 RepID=UPI00351272EE